MLRPASRIGLLGNSIYKGYMARDTKQKILLAAVREFADNGFHGATVRSIVERAEVKNLNAIVYYYGGKEGLYQAVLDFMFSEAEKFKQEVDEKEAASMNPEDRLVAMIRFLCRAYYSVETKLDQDLYNIFLKEAGNPTPFFNVMVERHLRSGRELMCSLLQEYLGPETPQSVIENCEYSISAQILYGALGSSIISRTNPNHMPIGDCIETFTDHIVTFTLAALQGLRAKRLYKQAT